jgi:hypothetical protein
MSRRAALAAALLAIAGTAIPQDILGQNVTVILNGQTMTFDQPPIVQAGRVFVPLRGVFQQLGATVVYANGQINATSNGRSVSLRIGSTQAVVNGQPTILDVAPFVVGSRTLVPLRFIAQSLGASVNWNDSTSTVTINSAGAVQPPPPQRPVFFTLQWPTGTVFNHYPQIRFQLNRPTAIGNFRLFLDGNDVTSGVSYNGQYYFVPAPFSLQMGRHRVRVVGRTRGGMRFDLNWNFNQGSY